MAGPVDPGSGPPSPGLPPPTERKAQWVPLSARGPGPGPDLLLVGEGLGRSLAPEGGEDMVDAIRPGTVLAARLSGSHRGA